jgi:hypothetical protein
LTVELAVMEAMGYSTQWVLDIVGHTFCVRIHKAMELNARYRAAAEATLDDISIPDDLHPGTMQLS